MAKRNEQSENVTWVSSQTLVALRDPAKNIPLVSGKIHAQQGGAYVSSFKGRGMEFDESRTYQPGDDTRNIDWRVTARSTTAYTKLFREERERPVLVRRRSTLQYALRNSRLFQVGERESRGGPDFLGSTPSW